MEQKLTEQIYHSPDIFKIYIPLPNNPLKNLNCYVVKTEEKNLIIDTGFNLPECLAAMEEGLRELGVDIHNTDLFLTHLHSDHVGLAPKIMPKGSTIYMGSVDYRYFTDSILGNDWDKTEKKYAQEGFPKDALPALRTTNPARAFAPDGVFTVKELFDQDKIQVGPYCFTCVCTPGHTPGHMCLYLEKEKLMFLGDHVLFDITPNITCWNHVDNSLKDYLQSLHKISTYDIQTALPAHRKNDMDFLTRVDQILKHHEHRLAECLTIIQDFPGCTPMILREK